MKKKVLIVDNCLRLWKEITTEFGKTVDEKFISNDEKLEISKEGFMRLENDNIELYITPEMQTSKKLIMTNSFDIYFLDNQIYDNYKSEKVLGQKELLNVIKTKNLDTVSLIYNISTHENSNGLNMCPKRGREIISIILGTKYEK